MVAVADAAMARKPTAICRSGPTCPPSVTSTGRLRTFIRDTTSADHTKLRAFTANATLGGPANSSAAPIAGPATIATLSTVLRSVLAAARSVSGTVSGVMAATAGS